MLVRLVKQDKIGFKEESLDMDGEKINKQGLKDQTSN